MNKTAQQQIVSDFYNAGIHLALKGGGMEKTAYKDVLKTLAPYLGAGGGALIGKELAVPVANRLQTAISRANMPDISAALQKNRPMWEHVSTQPQQRYGDQAYDSLKDSIQAALKPGQDLAQQESILSKLQTTDLFKDPTNALEAVTKAMNQQELAELGMMGAGIAGGGVAGNRLLKALRRHVN